MDKKYIRRKSTSRSGPTNGHQYTMLTIYTGQYGRTLSWTGRHRKDCEKCLREDLSSTPSILASAEARSKNQHVIHDFEEWVRTAGHAVYLTSCYLKSAFDASDRGDVEQAQELLIRCGRTIAAIPISPDGGVTAEMLCKAGDFLHDAAYALSNGDGPEAAALIDQSREQIKRYSQSLPRHKQLQEGTLQ